MQDQAFLGPESGLAVPGRATAASTSTSRRSGCTSTATRSRRASTCRPSRCGVTLAGVGGAFGAREDLSMQIHACLLALHTGPAGEDGVRPRGVVLRPRPPPPGAHALRARRDARRASSSTCGRGSCSTAAPTPRARPPSCANAACFAVRAVRRARTRRSTATSSTPTTRRAARCAASARCRPASPTSRRWTSSPPRSAWTRSSCGMRNAMVEGSRAADRPGGRRAPRRSPSCSSAAGDAAARGPPAGAARDLRGLPGGVGNTTHGEGVRRGVGYARRLQEHRLLRGLRRLLDRARAALDRRRRAAGRGAHRGRRGRAGPRDARRARSPAPSSASSASSSLPADTAVGSAGSSSASRQTWMTGGAVKCACDAVRERVLRCAEQLGDGELVLAGGEVRADGAARSRWPSCSATTPIEETREHHHRPTSPLDPETGQGDAHVAFAFSAHRAVVDVDVELGLVKGGRDRDRAGRRQGAQPAGRRGADRGRHRAGPRAGADGGDPGRRGARLRNPSFTDYLIPTILDMPPVRMQVLELGDPDAPYGLRRASASRRRSRPRRRSWPRCAPRRAPRCGACPSAPTTSWRALMLEGVGRRRLIDVARGDVEPDLVIEGARVFAAFTSEWLDVDVAIADGRDRRHRQLRRRRSAWTPRALPRARLHRRARAHRVVEADGRRVRARGARRTAPPRSSPTRTRSPTCSAPTASTGCSTSATTCRSTSG